MGRVIAVANQKGGVGKSTTAINLSACLAEKEKKVLTIDMDPQGNTTSGLGVDKNNVENTLYELLLGEAETKNTIVKNRSQAHSFWSLWEWTGPAISENYPTL